MQFFKVLIFFTNIILIITHNDIQEELEQIKKRIEKYISKSHIPGASLVLVKLDKETGKVYKLFSNYGISKNNKESYLIGSITKSFNALAINILIHENKLSLNDTIDKYIDLNKYFPKDKDKIQARNTTIKQLLTHSSGLVKNVKPGKKLSFPIQVGKYAYSNCGYALLGKIIEKISGMTFSDFVKNRIFNSLHMENCDVGLKAAKKNPSVKVIDSFINVYGGKIKKDCTNDQYDFLLPAGYILLSANDISKYCEMYLTKKADGISTEVIEDMFTKLYDIKTNISYGFGLYSFYYTTPDNKTVEVFNHTGNVETFFNSFAIIPELGLSGAMLTDLDDQYFNPETFLLNNFAKILLGLDVNIKDNYTSKIVKFDFKSFPMMIFGLLLIAFSLFQIISKNSIINNDAIWKIILRVAFAIFNVYIHIAFPTLYLKKLIKDNDNGLTFVFNFCNKTSLYLNYLIFTCLFYLGGVIRLIYYILYLVKLFSKTEITEEIKNEIPYKGLIADN